MIAGIIHIIWKALWNAVVVMVCASLIFIGFKANQPMDVARAPAGMTYIEFMQDRLDAAKTVRPSRCGWGMMLSLAALGPIYSLDYTWVATHPDGFLARVTVPDPDIPQNVAGASWYKIPGIWWTVVERLSWTMLAEHHPGCNLGLVQARSD